MSGSAWGTSWWRSWANAWGSVTGVVGPAQSNTDRYRQIARDVMALRTTGNSSNVMLAIGQRRRTR